MHASSPAERGARIARFAIALAVAACSREGSPPPEPAAPRDAGAHLDVGRIESFSPTEPSAAPASTASTAPALADPGAYATASPTRAKSIGHTSVVFKVELAGGLACAVKPESRRGKTRYRGEIAAYRLGVALGLRNVPPAFPRAFSNAAFEAVLDPAARTLFLGEAVPNGGTIRGAAMPWIPKLEFIPLESTTWRSRWQGWLARSGELPGDADRALAAQISTLVAFDTITGNWDRWSGANVGIDRPTGMLLFVDNDGAFFDPAPPGPLTSQLALLHKIDRFSRAFVSSLRALDATRLEGAIGEEEPGHPLLSPHVLASVDARRKQVLAHIGARVAELGEAAVLAFP